MTRASGGKPTVVFLHGLARTHRSMSGLRRHVAAAGYSTWAKSYPSRREGVNDLAHKVAGWIRDEIPDGPIVGVTHSLGGVLARHMATLLPWQGLVMVAPPNSGSRVAKALALHPLYQWFYGPAGQDLVDPSRWPAPPKPFAVVAGTRGASVGNPPSWFIRTLKLIPPDEKHDGTVTVGETQLDGMADYVEIDASHTWILNHPRTRELVLAFLATGSFGERSARARP